MADSQLALVCLRCGQPQAHPSVKGMLRGGYGCGHFICRLACFVALERRHGWIADMWCAACNDSVNVDSKENLEAARYVRGGFP